MSPSYIARQKSSWCFRIRIPLDLQPIIGKKELRYSLKTGSIGKAKLRARRAAAQAQLFFENLREKDSLIMKLRNTVIRELVDQLVREALNSGEEAMFELDGEYPQEDLEIELQSLEHCISHYQNALAHNNLAEGRITADRLLEENGLNVSKDSYEYKKLCREVLKAQLRATVITIRRARGEYFGGIISPQSYLPLQQQKSSELLSKVIDAYWKENDEAGNWSERTKVEYDTCLRLIKRILGNPQVHTISYETMRNFKETLMKLPANLNGKEYKDKSIDEILKMDIKRQMSVSTVNKYLGVAKGLFNYAVKNNHIENNPAGGLQITQKKRKRKASERRKIFTKEDLQKLFHSKEYLKDTHPHPHRFWLPILGLYTGCRIEELCQLYVDDVKNISGVWVLDLNEDNPDKKLKTMDSKRLVPLHPIIVELGFPRFIKAVKKKNKQRVFHELKKISYRYSHASSIWFKRYRTSCGVTDKDKTYHSFRHTLIDYLKQNDTGRSMVKQIGGHSDSDMTFGLYGKKYKVEKVYNDVISKIDFEIDLSHLKKSNMHFNI